MLRAVLVNQLRGDGLVARQRQTVLCEWNKIKESLLHSKLLYLDAKQGEKGQRLRSAPYNSTVAQGIAGKHLKAGQKADLFDELLEHVRTIHDVSQGQDHTRAGTIMYFSEVGSSCKKCVVAHDLSVLLTPTTISCLSALLVSSTCE